jgi:hypothetical protein
MLAFTCFCPLTHTLVGCRRGSLVIRPWGTNITEGEPGKDGLCLFVCLFRTESSFQVGLRTEYHLN